MKNLQDAVSATKDLARATYRQTLPCGFVNISVRGVRGKTLEALKSIGFRKDEYAGGYCFSMGHITHSQDMYFKRELAADLVSNLNQVLPDVEFRVWDRID